MGEDAQGSASGTGGEVFGLDRVKGKGRIMFGRNERLEQLRNGITALGLDLGEFKVWQKKYEKVSRQWLQVQQRYELALGALQQVQTDAQRMEQMLKEGTPERKAFAQLFKDMKRLQNSFDHEFLVSREDQEFHSTYDTILRLGLKSLEKQDDRLIFQSEIENLLALVQENLEKKEPDPKKLCYFYQVGTDEELAQMPPGARLQRIEEVYEADFLQPILKLLEEAVILTDRKRQEFGESDRKSKKVLDAVSFFPEEDGRTVSERANEVLSGILVSM